MSSPSAALNLSPSPESCSRVQVDHRLLADPALVPVAQKLAQGQRLDLADGLALMETTDLLGLGALAHAARLARHGRRTYYVRNQHLNYSNVCAQHCSFCAFRRDPDQEGGYLYSPRQAADKVRAAALAPAEVHIVGSCHPDMRLDYYVELLREVQAAAPQAAIKAFTAVEIDHIATLSGLDVRQTLAALKAAGLKAMTGGGAEVFSTRVRELVCPEKTSGRRWLEVSGIAHQMGVQTNATMLYGHVETPAERVEHLLALREQQDATGGFGAFIPLAYHAGNTKLGGSPQTSGLDDLRVVATSRLLLDNFPHIKAYWVMLSPKLAQVALNFGADDLDGTIVEERISHDAGATTAQALTEAALRGLIQNAGFQPVRRDAFYNSLEDQA